MSFILEILYSHRSLSLIGQDELDHSLTLLQDKRFYIKRTVAALHEILGCDDVVVRVASSSAGGFGQVGTCGGLVGGTIVLDYYFGRSVENMSYQECIQANLEAGRDAGEAAKLLYYRYIKEYGTIICPHIQVQLFGRHYYTWDPDEAEKFGKAGAHSDPQKSCCVIVGNAARWVMEILLDKDAVEL